MAASLFLAVSRRLQAPLAALLILGALQLALAARKSERFHAPTTHVRGALAATAQIEPERS